MQCAVQCRGAVAAMHAAEQCSELILNGSATYSSDTHKCRCDENSRSSDVFCGSCESSGPVDPLKTSGPKLNGLLNA